MTLARIAAALTVASIVVGMAACDQKTKGTYIGPQVEMSMSGQVSSAGTVSVKLEDGSEVSALCDDKLVKELKGADVVYVGNSKSGRWQVTGKAQ